MGGQTIIKRLKNGEELKGIFIKQVLEDSPAGRTKALKTGDKILEASATHTGALKTERTIVDLAYIFDKYMNTR